MILSEIFAYKHTGTIEYVKNRPLFKKNTYITGDSLMVWVRNAKFSQMSKSLLVY